jgi:hypothetical protein
LYLALIMFASAPKRPEYIPNHAQASALAEQAAPSRFIRQLLVTKGNRLCSNR